MVFLRYPFECNLKYIHFESGFSNVFSLKEIISFELGISDFLIYYNGKELRGEEILSNDSTAQVVFSLPGGKGGFGSMLRAIGAQIEKTTNREACRDLSGRRLRDINEEQRLKKWLAKEAEREAEKARRRKERLERLKSKPKHNFVDFEFEKEISTLPERVDDALTEGLQKVKPVKREASEPTVASKKKRLWVEEDLDDSSSTDSDTPQKSGNEDSLSSTSMVVCQNSSSANPEFSDSGTSNSNFPSQVDEGSHSMSASDSNDFSQPSTSKHNFTFQMDSSNCEDSSQSSLNKFSENKCSQNTNSECSDVGISENSMSNSNFSFNRNTNEHTKNDAEEQLTNNSGDSSKVWSECTDVTSVPADQNENESQVAENSSGSSLLSILPPPKDEGKEDDAPIDLMEYGSVAELEALGLERLKSALISRGLKCGGNISDRALRLWKVRGLQPSEYPSNLLAKNKK